MLNFLFILIILILYCCSFPCIFYKHIHLMMSWFATLFHTFKFKHICSFFYWSCDRNFYISISENISIKSWMTCTFLLLKFWPFNYLLKGFQTVYSFCWSFWQDTVLEWHLSACGGIISWGLSNRMILSLLQYLCLFLWFGASLYLFSLAF